MNSKPPLPLIDDVFFAVSRQLQPPPWAVLEIQRRLVLLINHVLKQEPQAMSRLARHKDRTLVVCWKDWFFSLRVTPAGLFDWSAEHGSSGMPAKPDLMMWITETSPSSLAQSLMSGQKPPVRIEGDVQLAAELNWLIDHVRWDLEEEISQFIGDAPAYALGRAFRQLQSALGLLKNRFKADAGTVRS
jgi:ubiquinone biosynthesis protein UbiJ